ncbi:MAG: hypothetical protein UV01_C0011G0010 [Parcubacteria group bacterium GW2011_GWA2_42_14]|nr:MAG: hypothetical protein UV01_C0011G0010 [Parcubacteria group bacterium GW2011_GWA2_42_14]
MKEYVEMAEKTLPAEGAKEKDVVRSAKERYSITYEKIWPEMEKLVKKDLELEELRKLLEQALSGSEGEKGDKKEGRDAPQGQKEDGETRPDPAKLRELLKQLPEELKKELEKMRPSQTGEEQPEKEKTRPDARNGQDVINEDKTEEEEENMEGKESGESAKGKKEKTVISGQEGGEKQEGNPLPLDQISDELKKELRKVFDGLSEEEKEFLQHMARKTLEYIEDEIVREFSGKLAEDEPETHVVFEARQKKEEKMKKLEEAEERLKREKVLVKHELEEIEKKQAKISENKNGYMRAYEEVRVLDDALYRRLDEIFTPNIKRNIKMKSAGLKPNLLKVFKWEAGIMAGAKALDSKIFESYSRHEKKDYVFFILNDMSNSMGNGGKIENDFKAKILLSEVLNRLGVKFAVAGFNDDFFQFKNSGEDLNDKIREKMNGMKMVEGYTDTGRALVTASRDLEKEFAKEKFLLVLTDGMPMTLEKDAPSETHRAVADILKKTSQKLIGIGLGPKTEFVREYFPASIVEEDVRNLPETLSALLEDMILNPEKYAYKNDR